MEHFECHRHSLGSVSHSDLDRPRPDEYSLYHQCHPGRRHSASESVCDPNLPSSQRSVNAYYKVSCFAAPTPGQYGTSAKGVIKGPSVLNLDTGIFKEFRFSKDGVRKLTWEFSALNVMNRQNWSNPGLNITTVASAGIISGVGGVNGGSIGDAPGGAHPADEPATGVLRRLQTIALDPLRRDRYARLPDRVQIPATDTFDGAERGVALRVDRTS